MLGRHVSLVVLLTLAAASTAASTEIGISVSGINLSDNGKAVFDQVVMALKGDLGVFAFKQRAPEASPCSSIALKFSLKTVAVRRVTVQPASRYSLRILVHAAVCDPDKAFVDTEPFDLDPDVTNDSGQPIAEKVATDVFLKMPKYKDALVTGIRNGIPLGSGVGVVGGVGGSRDHFLLLPLPSKELPKYAESAFRIKREGHPWKLDDSLISEGTGCVDTFEKVPAIRVRVTEYIRRSSTPEDIDAALKQDSTLLNNLKERDYYLWQYLARTPRDCSRPSEPQAWTEIKKKK